MAAFVVICFYLLMAILALAGLIATDYDLVDTEKKWISPSSEFLFGTDIFGRSVFHRAIHGSLVAVTVGFFSAMIALFIGVTMGALAGYFGGWVDDGDHLALHDPGLHPIYTPHGLLSVCPGPGPFQFIHCLGADQLGDSLPPGSRRVFKAKAKGVRGVGPLLGGQPLPEDFFTHPPQCHALGLDPIWLDFCLGHKN